MKTDKNKEAMESVEELDEKDLDQVVGGAARYVHKTQSMTEDMKNRA